MGPRRDGRPQSGEAPRITDVLQRTDPRRARTSGESQARLRSLAEALPHGMAYQVHVSADRAERRFTFVADTCPALNGGVTVEQALKDSEALYSLIAKEDRRRLHEAETEALETLHPFDIEVQFQLPDGQRRWRRLTSSPRKLPDGSTLWEGFQIDITARHSAEALLKNSQERLELAIDAARLGLWEYDIVTGDLMWNARIREMYGVGVDDPVDFDTFINGVHPGDRDRVLETYGEVVNAGGGDYTLEHRLVRPDGTVLWLLAHGRVLGDAECNAIRAIGTAMDITDRKQAEADNLMLLQELNHRVKNSFATVASLLTLRARRSEHPETREQLNAAVNQVMSIAQAYAHLYAGGQPHSVDFADYLRDLCNGLAQGLTDGERVRLEVLADAAVMTTDHALPLGMAVNELVTNAIKYAFPEGRTGRIEVRFETHGEHWRLLVSDDGVGLPAEFERSGGLGANLLKSFARQAGGRLTILDGPGARFEIASA